MHRMHRHVDQKQPLYGRLIVLLHLRSFGWEHSVAAL